MNNFNERNAQVDAQWLSCGMYARKGKPPSRKPEIDTGPFTHSWPALTHSECGTFAGGSAAGLFSSIVHRHQFSGLPVGTSATTEYHT